MPKTGENIYKRKDGRWEGRYIKGKSGGKTRYGSVYAASYREVKEKVNRVKTELKNKEQPATNVEKVADIGRQWLSEAALTLKESSTRKYEDIFRCYILPEFGADELSKVTDKRVISFVNFLLSEGGVKKQGLTPATVAEVLSAMNGIRSYAIKRGYSVFFSTECIRLKRRQKDIRIFSREEEQQLLNYLRENMDLPALGVLICLFTGIRVGELCAMKWDDISLEEKRMHVCKTMLRIRIGEKPGKKTEVKISQPKSVCSIRTIPLPDMIIGILKKFYIPRAFILTGDSERYVEPRTMQNHFKRILSACGIRDANFHVTRHTFATRCIELGFDVKSLSEILGHANVSTTMNRYVHPTMELKTENMNRFSELFSVK